MRVTVVRADYGKHTASFRNNGYVGIGWFDPPLPDSRDRATIRAMYERRFPDQTKSQVDQGAGQVYRFLNNIAPGGLVVTPYNDGRLLVGRVTGEPYAEADGTSPYAYRIPVDWRPEPLDRSDLSIPLQNTLKSSLTVFNVKQVADICEAAGIEYDGAGDPSAAPKAAVQERADVYEAVKGVLLELDDKEFERLVSYVLQTLGFEATQETGQSGDGGIDFEGELRVMGVASIQLQVQVKRYADNSIKETQIRSFRGALNQGYQGCFITLSRFAKKAKESAKDPKKAPINLINGRQFVEIMTEQYDQMVELMLAEDNDDLVEKLRFRKALVPA